MPYDPLEAFYFYTSVLEVLSVSDSFTQRRETIIALMEAVL